MTKKKSRNGFVDVPPDVTPLRERADALFSSLLAALEATQSAAAASQALDSAQTARIQDRFDAVGRPATPGGGPR